MSSITKIYEDRLGMANMKVSVGFGRESCPYLSAGSGQVSFTEVGVNLRISSRFV